MKNLTYGLNTRGCDDQKSEVAMDTSHFKKEQQVHYELFHPTER